MESITKPEYVRMYALAEIVHEQERAEFAAMREELRILKIKQEDYIIREAEAELILINESIERERLEAIELKKETDRIELEQFAKSCGWDGTCIKTSTTPTAIDMRKRKHASHGGDCWGFLDSIRPLENNCKCVFETLPLANAFIGARDTFYPCPSCHPTYWAEIQLNQTISTELANDAITVLGLQRYKPRPRKPTDATPDPDGRNRYGGDGNMAIVLLLGVVQNQQAQIDALNKRIPP